MQSEGAEKKKQALCEIKEAARDIGITGWSRAKDLDGMIDLHLPVIVGTAGLQTSHEAMRRRIHQQCLAWQNNYRSAAAGFHLDVYEAALGKAQRLAELIDGMLATLQPSELATQR